MTIRFPSPLRAGSKIAVVAPSSPVPAALAPRLELALGHLRSLGFEPRESRCLRAEETPSRDERLAAWMEALLDDENDAVMPPWGGDLAIELVDGMDFDRLRRARPRWILGYSDISTLLVPLLLEAGWASAHGPNLMDLVPDQRDPISARTLDWLSSDASFTQASSTHYQTAFVDWKRWPGAAFQLDQPTTIRTLDGKAVRARGRLIGGCIDTIMSLAGTRFGDVPRFLRAHHDEGVIVFLENCDLDPPRLARALTHVRLAGWLGGASAVLIGRSSARETNAAAQETVLRRVFDGIATPVVHGLDIGHQPPQWTLIEGALATLEVEDGRATITQEW
jgi:muramoyltetrapeptide carboxypeptidase LdcA involved in peptidoglycan recycling